MSRTNVVLTGFMATGKSAVGRLIADLLGYEWVDTDAQIEARHGPITEIFRNNGEESFRELEHDLAVELSGRRGLVISTGGRMMLDVDNARVLGAAARVFCLTASVGEILRRVGEQEGLQRPLLAGASPRARIDALLAERAEGYAQFEQIDTNDRSIADVAAEIVSRLQIGD